MKATWRDKIDTSRPPKEDPYYPAACENAKEVFRRMREAGSVDAEGRSIRTDLPADSKPGQSTASDSGKG